jgi:hypothetical protein
VGHWCCVVGQAGESTHARALSSCHHAHHIRARLPCSAPSWPLQRRVLSAQRRSLPAAPLPALWQPWQLRSLPSQRSRGSSWSLRAGAARRLLRQWPR